MNKYDLDPEDEILDIMMEDAAFIKGGFENLNRETIRNVLTGKDTEVLKKILVVDRTSVKEADVKFSEIYRESIQLKVSADQLTGKICLLPNGELQEITQDDIEDALYFFGIRVGIIKTVIHRLADTLIYNRDFVIARGIAPIDGKQGDIRFYFDTNPKTVITIGKKDRVDYKELGKFQTVKEGDLLCEWIDGTAGEDGTDIFGNVISAAAVQASVLRQGKNTFLSEDGKQIFASVDGEVSCKDAVVSVDKVLKLRNVDATTGNIRFIGSIHVSGKICEGFIVKATQNITVEDVVENSKVSAGNDLTVARGIINSDEIDVGGSINTNFIEGSNVYAKKDIIANVILTSQIVCEGRVRLSGRKGSLIGGYCCAREVDVMNLGNEAHARTDVEIMSCEKQESERSQEKRRLQELEQEVSQKQKLLDMLKRADTNSEKCLEMQSEIFKLMYEKNSKKINIDKLTETLDFLQKEYCFQVKVQDKLFPNTRVKMYDLWYVNQEPVFGCVLKFDGDQIVAET